VKVKRRLSQRRTAGSVQWLFFFLSEKLQEAIRKKTQRQMMVQPAPGTPFEMIEP